MIMIKRKLIFSIPLIGLSLSAFATMPVFDYTNFGELVKEYTQLQHQYTLLSQTYQNAQQQLSQAKEIASDAEGHYGWSNFKFKDYQSYGTGGGDISSLFNLAKQGGGSSSIGSSIDQLSKDFPINTNTINQVITDPQTQKYYTLKAETTLANRAASQADYNNIQKQIDYQNQLRAQIDNTKNTKSAIDLLTRSQIEGNLINLEILRQTALANQQSSVNSQAELNDEVLNANFLK